jgi:hypothetical protein
MFKVGEFFIVWGGLLLMGSLIWAIERTRGDRRVARLFFTMGTPFLLIGLLLLLLSLAF